MSPVFSAYVLLGVGRFDEFTVEGAWSCDGRLPDHIPLGTPVDYPALGIERDQPVENRFRFRLGQLWDPGADKWWVLAPSPTLHDHYRRMELLSQGVLEEDPPIEEAIVKVEPLVNEVIIRIKLYAVLCFLEIAKGFECDKEAI
ncbi:hypothetical protein [Singulisphaera sp. GP187]|uniref:hypothetical protein n=1 Tax=Singulisphaera sp. GP187 TaxID=1882752 RepID=UPI0009415816|nr:hypothetical protein [Singulisphaera sp. GP187]